MCHNNCVYTKKYITNHRNVLLIREEDTVGE